MYQCTTEYIHFFECIMLTYLIQLVFFYIPWNHQKTSAYLIPKLRGGALQRGAIGT